MKIYQLSILAATAALMSCSNSAEKEGTAETAVEEKSLLELSLEVPEEARTFFVDLQSGDEVKSPFVVQMGVEGMLIEPAGELIPGTGHHHLLIGSTGMAHGEVIPADETHIHYGLGQTSDTLDLAPGNYTLTLQFANGAHQSMGGQMASSVEIIVVE